MLDRSLGSLRPRWGRRRGHVGAYLVLVILACGLTEIVIRRQGPPWSGSARAFLPVLILHGAAVGGLGALVWVAFKVGALSYGGGFVIVPLIQHDVVVTYHWMTGAEFLNAVALGQITPGPVVQTMAVVGYAAGGLGGGLLAAWLSLPLPSSSCSSALRTSTRSTPTTQSNRF